jgi:hypothetical protein
MFGPSHSKLGHSVQNQSVKISIPFMVLLIVGTVQEQGKFVFTVHLRSGSIGHLARLEETDSCIMAGGL